MRQKRIHLLYFINSFGIGGAEKAMVRIVSGLNEDKYEIAVAALERGSGKLLPEIEELGVQVLTLGVRGKYDIRAIARLCGILKSLEIQVLVCSLFHATILGRITGRLSHVPIIINWEHNENFGGFLRVFLNKATSPFSNKIICDSKRVEMEAKRRLELPEEKVKVVPIGGIDLVRYSYKERGSSSSIKAGSVGILTEQKGYPYLIQAAKLVLEKRADIEFYIVGDGPEFERLQKLVKEFRLARKIKLVGFQSDIPTILSKWDIYIQPSLWEGLCITVVEAMASGLPIVATSVGGIPESVVDGYNGFLVLPRNPEVLAAKILELVENHDLRVKMGRASRKIAEEKYSLHEMVRRVEETIDDLVVSRLGMYWDQEKKHWESTG